jgi:hypothetical protein
MVCCGKVEMVLKIEILKDTRNKRGGARDKISQFLLI